jgi:hypothetical protein
MVTEYNEFLEEVINNGIEAANNDYSGPENKLRLEGALKGFEKCRGKSPLELRQLLATAKEEAYKARREEKPDVWSYICEEGEIDWVCNCVSARATILGTGEEIIIPTANGIMAADDIINER